MQRLIVILCAVSGVVFANMTSGTAGFVRAHSGTENLYHAHTHYHDGEAHTHWHSHAAHEEHSQTNEESDHHDEVGGHDHDDPVFFPPPARASLRRDTNGKLLVDYPVGDCWLQIEPPVLLPSKPPPRFSPCEKDILRLRTVILLT